MTMLSFSPSHSTRAEVLPGQVKWSGAHIDVEVMFS